MLSCPYFIKKRPFSTNKLLLCAYFVIQTSILYKTLWSNVIFSHNFREKSLLSCPYLVKKTSILPKLEYITDQIRQRDALFPLFHEKFPVLMPLYCQKFQKYNLKNTVLSYHFFQFCHENHPVFMPIFFQKREFC